LQQDNNDVHTKPWSGALKDQFKNQSKKYLQENNFYNGKLYNSNFSVLKTAHKLSSNDPDDGS